ncbi:topless-related 4-like [Olea europaea subsp. europaea]|uniref:Topless-related 4-like n=1 Tax=Olea europaea subsp. europaea TaxID=158383 RepID=A0A8S0TL17_OLEEU|nr:topless-related 4-like [Olea europaea subsp. europaea]
MPYFEERVTNGDWDEVENYLSGFTRPDENTNSKKIFNAIQEHKCLEVLDREDKEVSKYGDLINARSEMLAHVKKLIEENPVFCDKLIFPTFDPSALGTLSLNLQHHLASVSPSHSVPKPVESPPPFQDPSSLPQPSASNPHPSASAGFNTQNNSDNLKHPTTPTNKPAVENQNDLSELDLYETRSSEMSNESPPLSISGDDNASTGSSIEDRVSPVVPRLMYTNSGSAILALYVNAVHKMWKSPENDSNSLGNFPANCIQCCTARLMTGMNPEDAVPCFALSNNDSYVVSASGQEISYFNTLTFQTKKSFKFPSSAVTFLAFHPQNNNIIAIGLDDSSIQIYDVEANEVKTELKAHQKRITGLAFSNILNVLVSSGADSQLCVWSTDTWEKQTNEYLRSPAGASLAATLVQFHQDQTHLLAVQETQLVIYEAEVANLDWRVKWPLKASVSITYATYSCDSKSIYVSFKCGSISVLTAASLRLRCRINPSLYLLANPSLQAYPLVIAAHPSKPNQFAVGLSDGGVYVLEPLESEGKWYL